VRILPATGAVVAASWLVAAAVVVWELALAADAAAVVVWEPGLAADAAVVVVWELGLAAAFQAWLAAPVGQVWPFPVLSLAASGLVLRFRKVAKRLRL